MGRLLAIFFLVLFTSTTEAAEVFKFPFLVSHWQLHEKEGRTSTFYNFLKEHYSTNHNDNDKKQDEELPFKTLHIDHIMLVYTSESLPPLKAPIFHLPATPNFYCPSYIPLTHLLGIFHPPRNFIIS